MSPQYSCIFRCFVLSGEFDMLSCGLYSHVLQEAQMQAKCTLMWTYQSGQSAFHENGMKAFIYASQN